MLINKPVLIGFFLLNALSVTLAACTSTPAPIPEPEAAINSTKPVISPTRTPLPTSGSQQIEKDEAYYINLQPQPGVVAYNRVDAFIQAHDFLDGFQAALSDGYFSPDELELISQLAANAEASLYNTGDWQVMDFARKIDALSKNAIRGEWSQAKIGIEDLRKSLPARPRP